MSAHFNGLSPAEAERLACLAEECGEVIQAIGKVLRHGYESRHPMGGETNRQALEREVGDVYATVELLVKAADLNDEEIKLNAHAKHESRKAYFHHQKHHRITP